MTATPSLRPDALYRLDVSQASNLPLLLLSSYDIEFQVPPKTRMKFGRFSLGLISRIRLFPHPDQSLVFEAGAFCESAMDSIFIVGGEHKNETFFNATMAASAQLFRPFMDEEAALELAISPARKMLLGDNVIVSTRAIVLDGSEIGEGCVIGAGAVATGPHAPFGIYGGVPACRIRDRFGPDLARLWRHVRLSHVRAHEVPRLPAALRALQTGELTLDEFDRSIERMEHRPSIVVNGRVDPLGTLSITGILGFRIDDAEITDSAAIQALGTYFGQVNKTDTIDWSPDIFHKLGLS